MSYCCVTFFFLELGRRSGKKTGALAQSQPVFRPDCKHLLLTLSLQETIFAAVATDTWRAW